MFFRIRIDSKRPPSLELPRVQHDARPRQSPIRTRHLDGERADPRDRAERRADQGEEDRDLRHRRPYLQLGPVGAKDRSGADGHRPRIRRHRGGFRFGGHRIQGRAARLGRGAHRVRALPKLPGGQGASVPQYARRRRQPARRVRRVSRAAAAQRRPHPRRHSRRGRGDLRPARQRRPYRAVLRSRRRGRAGHGRRADRHHGRAGGAGSRRARSSSPTSTRPDWRSRENSASITWWMPRRRNSPT